jgi:tetrahydromethanopterin S-methyltransferase subunit A
MKQDEILKVLRADLKEAFDTPKCKKCGCLRDTFIALRDETVAVMGAEADALRADIAAFLDGMEPIKYECLGCDPCYPAVAENRFHAAAEGVLPLHEVNRPSCAFEMRTDGEWPLVPGEYVVVDHAAPVAVSTLASADLPQRLAALHPRGLAIVGKTETENIGIDKIVKNVVANPCIRVLVVAGQEPKGHLSGQTLLALAANGVDERMRVVGSPGKRPFLRNVTTEDVEQFGRQVEIVDLIGCEDAERIAQEVEAHALKNGCACETAGHVATAPSVPHIRATPATRLKLDKAGYFVILPQPDKGIILVEHYDYQDRLLRIIEGDDARTMCATLIELGLVSQLDHAAYLGRELMRAELSLRLGLPFVQDGAQGILEEEAVICEPPLFRV